MATVSHFREVRCEHVMAKETENAKVTGELKAKTERY